MLIPQIQYITNDSWELASAIAGDNGFPLALDAPYGRGHLYVLTIPDNFADLYRLPAAVLDSMREVVTDGLPARMAGPAKVALYDYDNGTLVLESFRDEPVTVDVLVAADVRTLKNIASGELLRPSAPAAAPRGPAPAVAPGARFSVPIPPHSFVGLSVR